MSNSRMIRLWHAVLTAGALAAATSCGSLGSSASEVDPAYLEFDGLTSTIIVNDTVTRGSVFAIGFDTYGVGCTNQNGGDEISINGLTVDIRPSNRTNVTPSCGTDFITIKHTATASVLTAGTATIKITGLTDQPATGSASNLITIQKTIVVQ